MSYFTVWLKVPAWLAGIRGDSFVYSSLAREHAEAYAETALLKFINDWSESGLKPLIVADVFVEVIDEANGEQVYLESVRNVLQDSWRD